MLKPSSSEGGFCNGVNLRDGVGLAGLCGLAGKTFGRGEGLGCNNEMLLDCVAGLSAGEFVGIGFGCDYEIDADVPAEFV